MVNTIEFKTCSQDEVIEWLLESPPCEWDIILNEKDSIWIKFYAHPSKQKIELEIV
jgi:hypothetical protein